MRRVALIVSGLSLSLLLALPGAALAVGTLDQEQSDTSGAFFTGISCPAQTFTAGLTGVLDRTSLYLRRLGGSTTDADLRIAIHATTSEGTPTGTILASELVDGGDVSNDGEWFDVDFTSPTTVAEGTVYAIGLRPTADPDAFGWGSSGAPNPYAAGGVFHSSPCGTTFSPATHVVDLAFRTYVTEAEPQPDGRIRLGSGNWVGGNIYNTTGVDQTRTAAAHPGNSRLFRIQVQNDGTTRDKFTIDADGAAVSGYQVEFMKRTTDITSRVNGGTFQTRWLDPGERATIEAWVYVKAGAAQGSSISRLVTLSSLADPTQVDTVTFTVSRQ